MKSTEVFETEELRAYILSYSDDSTLAICARVRKIWTNEALRILWNDMNDILPLFKILGPMELNADGFFDYTNTEENECRSRIKWKRLMEYGARIKRLSIKGNKKKRRRPSMKVLNELGIWRPSLSLTPNLQSLTIPTSDDIMLCLCSLVLHPDIRTLKVITDGPASSFERLMDSIIVRIPDLQSLDVEVAIQMSSEILNDVLIRTLPQLQRLEILILPRRVLSAKLLVSIGKSRTLTKVHINNCIWCTASRPLFPISSQVSAFPPLTTLEASTNFSTMRSFILCLPNLESLRIVSNSDVESASTLGELIECASRALPSLNELVVEYFTTHEEDMEEDSEGLYIATLNPLTSLKRLKRLKLAWPVPLLCTDEELSTLLSKMPHIEVLNLISRFYRQTMKATKTQLTLNILPLITLHCRSLKYLALFVDCFVPSPFIMPSSVDDSLNEKSAIRVFDSLETLDLGDSLALGVSAPALALRLSRILPPCCKVIGFMYNEDDFWVDVARLTRILAVARREEQRETDRRMHALEERMRREFEAGKYGTKRPSQDI